MRKVITLFLILSLIACGKSSKTPNVHVPVYKLVNIDEPKIGSNGYISPTQNLVYNIEIKAPLQKDSLEILQDYFIKKGKVDYEGINKVIVRVYLNGTSLYGIPYASLNLVGEKKEININKTAIKLDSLINKPSTSMAQEATDPFLGSYFCERTHDSYVFKPDNTGLFISQGGNPSEFTWKRQGSNLTLKYEVFGEEKLKYDSNAKTITETDELFGTLLFVKR